MAFAPAFVMVRQLLCRSIYCALVNWPNSVGILPVNWLLYNTKSFKPFNWPNSVGIPPVNWLLPKFIWVKLFNWPISVEINP